MKTDETFIYRKQGKKWTLPKLLQFGYNNVKTYKILDYRFPKKGEYFLSGAICEAYKALNDLTTKYLVVEPSKVEFIQKIIWVQKTN